MQLIQFDDAKLGPSVGVLEESRVHNLTAAEPRLTHLPVGFLLARAQGERFASWLEKLRKSLGDQLGLDYSVLEAEGRLRAPITETPNVHVLVTGTGLTHTGSVKQRDDMHKAAAAAAKTDATTTDAPKSDSRKIFELGLEGGKPAPGSRGAAPEWFYKGDGRILRGPGQPLDIPAFAPDGGEEPEIAGVYMIDTDGTPFRLGFVQGNEWSDHVTENINYLYLAPSKLRTCAIGPALVTNLKFDDVRGTCEVKRDGKTIYESGELFMGEENMCHSLANLEDHHFKFPQHRQPGDVHIHFFGTCKLSFQHRDWKYAEGDTVEVSINGCGPTLRNPIHRVPVSTTPVVVE